MLNEPTPPKPTPPDLASNVRLALRSVFGGTLMGLANLVPGISGGTMLLVAGVYPAFIEALSDVTRLRFRRQSVLVLSCIGMAAGLGILLFAGILKELVLDHRWVMYSLFIGLTIGGLPLVWRLAQPVSKSLLVYATVSFIAMAILAWLKANQVVGSSGESLSIYFLAGLIAAMAMILPGISGAYLLLLIGKHASILAAVDQFKIALAGRDVSAMLEPLKTLLPVAMGVAIGIVLTGNLIKWLLAKYPKLILGVLIGLLLGSVCGLYPFQEGIAPQVGSHIKGVLVTAENLQNFDKKDWLVEYRTPSPGSAMASLSLIAIGFGLTWLVEMVGRERR